MREPRVAAHERKRAPRAAEETAEEEDTAEGEKPGASAMAARCAVT